VRDENSDFHFNQRFLDFHHAHYICLPGYNAWEVVPFKPGLQAVIFPYQWIKEFFSMFHSELKFINKSKQIYRHNALIYQPNDTDYIDTMQVLTLTWDGKYKNKHDEFVNPFSTYTSVIIEPKPMEPPQILFRPQLYLSISQ